MSTPKPKPKPAAKPTKPTYAAKMAIILATREGKTHTAKFSAAKKA